MEKIINKIKERIIIESKKEKELQVIIDELRDLIKDRISEQNLRSNIDYLKTLINSLFNTGDYVKDRIINIIKNTYVDELRGVYYNSNKPLSSYACGYFLRIETLLGDIIIDTRIYKYAGIYAGREVHPYIVAELDNQGLNALIEFVSEQMLYYIKDEAERIIKILKDNFKHKSILPVNNSVIYNMYSKRIVLFNDSPVAEIFFDNIIKKRRQFKKKLNKLSYDSFSYVDNDSNYYICRSIKDVFEIKRTTEGRIYLEQKDIPLSPYEANLYKKIALGIVMEKKMEGEKEILMSLDEESIGYILYYIINTNNEEHKRVFVEALGGWESVLVIFGEKISEGNDGVYPIYLYRIGNLKFLLVRDHSTDRQYALCPPNQNTNNAKEAWESTFPCKITYRHGDVGIARLTGEGLQVDIQEIKKQS